MQLGKGRQVKLPEQLLAEGSSQRKLQKNTGKTLAQPYPAIGGTAVPPSPGVPPSCFHLAQLCVCPKTSLVDPVLDSLDSVHWLILWPRHKL